MKKKRWLAALLAAGIVAAQCVLPAGENGFSLTQQVSAFTSWSIQQDASRPLVSGLTQTEYSYTVNGVSSRYITLTLSPDSGVTLRPAMPSDGVSVGRDTVRDMANSAVLHGDNVVAAINSDMYNINTGEPWGVVIQNGDLIHGYNVAGRDWLFFGFTKDGEVVYGDKSVYDQKWPELEQAMGLHCVLVENGVNVCTDQSATRAPRTAVGVKKDGTVFFLAADGRQDSSIGLSLTELADLMIKEGAVWAGNLDGGGSTTVVSREIGSDSLTVQNTPSDGSERNVANCWLFVASGEPTAAQTEAANVELYGKVVSDTTNPVSIQPGKSYQFRMTVVAGSNPPCCYLESNEYFEVVYTGNSGRDYFYKVTAKEGAPSGASTVLYSVLPGQSGVKQCEVRAG